MASYDVYKKQADQSTDDYAKKKQAQAATLWESMQGGYDQLNETARKNAETQIENQKQEYRDLHDQTAVQELLDRRYTNEAMANAGLTDSGLNRTQQTAITLARGNRDASLTRQQQAARDATMLALDQMIAENKAKAAAEKAAIDQQVWADIENYRNAQYGAIGDWAEAENAQALALAKLDAEAKQKEADRLAESAKQLETNRLAVYADMIGAGYTSEKAWNEAIRLFPGAGENGGAGGVVPPGKTLTETTPTPYSQRTWYRTKITGNSGINTSFGLIDDNDVVTDGTETLTMRELYDNLINKGEMDAASAKKYILNLQNQNAAKVINGVGYTAKTPNTKSTGSATAHPRVLGNNMKQYITSGQLTKEDAVADVMNYFFPSDIENQKIALGQLGLSDETINALIMANAG